MQYKPKPLDSTLNHSSMGRWWINTQCLARQLKQFPLPWWPSKGSSSSSCNLLLNPLFIDFVCFCISLFHSLNVFPWDHSQKKLFHSNPCLGVCYWGTQTKRPTRIIFLITEKCIHSLAPIKVLTNNTVNPGLSNTVEDFKCIWSKLRCAVCIQYTMDFKDSVKIFFSH